MMREIKFRAWFKEKSRMYNVGSIDFDLGKIDVFPKLVYYLDFDEVELMQYTGLKDKNGKEIYEGDLFDYGGFGSVEVKLGYYDNGKQYEDRDAGYGWYLLGHNKKHPYCHSIDYLDWGPSVGSFNKQVIGNIYENLELVQHDTSTKA